MKTLAILGLMTFTISNTYANECYVQETTDRTFLVIIEDGPILGEYKTLQEASVAIKEARNKQWCE